MSDDDKTEINVDGLDKLLKAFKNPPQLNVGILGGGARAPSKAGEKRALTNAEIGAFHEFGTSKLPQRSFLRVPLINHLNKRLIESGVLGKDEIKEAIKSGTMIPVMLKVGIVAEQIVADAFDTGGFGEWRPSNMSKKQNHQTLVETQQLRDSITSEVVDNEE